MRVLADDKQINELIDAMAEAIRQNVQHRRSRGDWALIGIRSRGDILAARIAERLGPDIVGQRVGSLDITLYRDDLSEIGNQPIVQTTEIPFALDGLNIVLIDDVLMTGRSVRAALQSLMDLGRPSRVWLSVLVDRGGRELPIAPDHKALDLSADAEQGGLDPRDLVEVHLAPRDDKDAIIVRSAAELAAEASQ